MLYDELFPVTKKQILPPHSYFTTFEKGDSAVAYDGGVVSSGDSRTGRVSAKGPEDQSLRRTD